MINKKLPLRGALVTALLSAALLAACAAPQQRADVVGVRAQARWDALLSEDIQTAYGYLTPGYRSSVSLLQYHKELFMNRVNWTKAKYIESDCSESTCKVEILLNYQIVGALPGVNTFQGSQQISENWIRTDGQWWFVPKQ